ncbi:MAG: hypothetical protein Q7T13_00655 [Polaromonas sp.]|nr:hypothetical protein [Polaromonas sp.]
MDKLDSLHSEISSLRMVVAIDSAMLLSVMRRMNADQLAMASRDFLEVCEGLSIKALFSEMDDHSIQSAQKRRDWWIGLVAEVVANEAVGDTPPPSGPAPDASPS